MSNIQYFNKSAKQKIAVPGIIANRMVSQGQPKNTTPSIGAYQQTVCVCVCIYFGKQHRIMSRV